MSLLIDTFSNQSQVIHNSRAERSNAKPPMLENDISRSIGVNCVLRVEQ